MRNDAKRRNREENEAKVDKAEVGSSYTAVRKGRVGTLRLQHRRSRTTGAWLRWLQDMQRAPLELGARERF